MDFNQIHQLIINDIAVKVRADIDDNFRRKAFYNQAWPKTKLANSEGSMMIRKGLLKKSFNVVTKQDSVGISSSLDYAAIHNTGGEITVTARMKRFFWAKHMEARENGDRTGANQWKAMAIKKVGSVIKIPKRQFIGDHPDLRASIVRVVDHNIQELNDFILNKLKP